MYETKKQVHVCMWKCGKTNSAHTKDRTFNSDPLTYAAPLSKEKKTNQFSRTFLLFL